MWTKDSFRVWYLQHVYAKIIVSSLVIALSVSLVFASLQLLSEPNTVGCVFGSLILPLTILADWLIFAFFVDFGEDVNNRR